MEKTILLRALTFLLAAWIFTGTLSGQEDRARWKEMHASKKEALVAFNEAKFGLFIHWGIYARPAGIWEGEKIPGIGEWIMYRARIPRDTYRELTKDFNPTGFDAREWVRIAKKAGMKYVVAMPKHHDGFSMYHSGVTDYDIGDATPFHADPIQELYDACQQEGLRFGFYYSHATDWMDGGDAGVADFLKQIEEGKRDKSEHDERGGREKWPANTWDPADITFEEYIDSKAIPQVKELMAMLPETKEIWYDVPRYMTEEQSFRFYKTVYDLNPSTLINSRVGNDFGDYWVPGDNKIPTDEVNEEAMYWETPGTMNNTWGYKSYDLEWKSVRELVFWIVEIASKGGNYLLNVGPKADGTISRESVDTLMQIGSWMEVNGEAIYGSRPWMVNKEGPTSLEMKGTSHRAGRKFDTRFTSEDFWFTSKGDNVYVISMTRPADGEALVRSLAPVSGKIREIRILGHGKPLSWDAGRDGVKIELPRLRKGHPLGYTLQVTMKE